MLNKSVNEDFHQQNQNFPISFDHWSSSMTILNLCKHNFVTLGFDVKISFGTFHNDFCFKEIFFYFTSNE